MGGHASIPAIKHFSALHCASLHLTDCNQPLLRPVPAHARAWFEWVREFSVGCRTRNADGVEKMDIDTVKHGKSGNGKGHVQQTNRTQSETTQDIGRGQHAKRERPQTQDCNVQWRVWLLWQVATHAAGLC